MDEKEYLKQLGATISKLRKQKKISHQELALLSEIEKSSVIRIEQGKYNPKFTTLLKLSRGLSVHISKFLTFLPKDYFKEKEA